MKHSLKKALSLILCLTLSALASCAGEPETAPDVTQEPAPAEIEETAETEAPVPTSDYPKLTDFCWTLSKTDATGFLLFEGTDASLFILSDGEARTISGRVEVKEKTMTIDGVDMGWAVVASFCKITLDGVGYSFTKADDPAAAMGPYELLTNAWEGDGASLSFDGEIARLSIEGETGASGTWDLTGGKTLTIHDDAQGDPTNNLAVGAKVTASSQETADFPAPLAADGNFETRWSSEYVDPSWLLLDLGETKHVGAAVVYFETACSADFTFETSSDGVNFEEAASVTDNSAAGTGDPVTVLFSNPADCRFVRFNGLSRATSWGHSIYELELYEYIPGEAECSLAFDGGRLSLTVNGRTYLLEKKS